MPWVLLGPLSDPLSTLLLPTGVRFEALLGHVYASELRPSVRFSARLRLRTKNGGDTESSQGLSGVTEPLLTLCVRLERMHQLAAIQVIMVLPFQSCTPHAQIQSQRVLIQLDCLDELISNAKKRNLHVQDGVC